MQPGTFLVDFKRGEERFRISRLLHDGRSYQIALAEDTLMDDKLVCVKAISYDVDKGDDKAYVAGRRKALHNEMTFLALDVHLLPEPLDWIQLEESQTVMPREPVLVYEYVHGDTLYDYVRERFPNGLNPARALRLFRELAKFLRDIHKAGYVFRDLDPRHVVISFDDIIHVVGCGNATAIGERPNATKLELNHCYAAPEIRTEMSGKGLRPAADIYSLGALLTFMLTGEEPRERIENPLSKVAYERLTSLDDQGISLLIAKCMQPMAKNRIARVERLLPFCEMDALPTPQTKGFGLLQLPAPWSGAEHPDTRAARSSLSPGPLISVAPGEPEPPQEGQEVVVAPETAPASSEPQGCGAVLYRLREVLGLNK